MTSLKPGANATTIGLPEAGMFPDASSQKRCAEPARKRALPTPLGGSRESPPTREGTRVITQRATSLFSAGDAEQLLDGPLVNTLPFIQLLQTPPDAFDLFVCEVRARGTALDHHQQFGCVVFGQALDVVAWCFFRRHALHCTADRNPGRARRMPRNRRFGTTWNTRRLSTR